MTLITTDRLEGMWAGLPVPWTAAGQLDEPALRENVRRTCRAGAHGVYTHGTTGEFYAQTPEEWRRVVTATIEEARPFETPVQAGCTALWTQEVIRRADFAQKAGVGAVQVAFPFWLTLTDDQAVRFLQELAAAVPGIPVIIYNTERSKKPLTAALLKRILDSGVPVIGCKGARGKEDLKALTSVAPGVHFFVGEPDLAELWEYGARGCYSSLIYACPRLMLRYFEQCREGSPEALQTSQRLKRMIAEFVMPRLKSGMYDTAFDRTFATATGFLSGSLLFSRAPYDSATTKDVNDFIEYCESFMPEFLEQC